jgi:DNA polymerase III alpha subunit
MIRTGFSFHTAIGNLNAVLERLHAVGYPAAPICDRNSTFGFNRWTKAAKKHGMRPVYGVELACVPQLGERRPTIDYWSFLATDSLRPLHDLIYLATANPGKEPQLTYRQALSAPGVVRISGNRTQLQHINDDDPILISLRPSTPRGLYKEAARRNLPFIACSDNYYPTTAERELYRVALGKRADTQSYPQHILTREEWWQSVSWFVDPSFKEDAIARINETLEKCHATLQKASLLKPQITKTLAQLCEEGAQRTSTDLSNPIYRARLEKELKLIEEKDFADYFYILADLVSFAKDHMVVGPARGSSCGSLVCYLLNITAVDPIPFGLIFERFIDITRTDLPDVDIDFSDIKKTFDYVEQKYGRQHVAHLGTIGVFRPRSALNQAGMALRIPKWEVEKVLETVIERSGGDARALQTLEDTLSDTDTGRKFIADNPEIKIIISMEGEPNNPSTHAAGIVLTQDPIIDYVAIDARSKSVMCDKKDAEDFNLLKIDALGLTQLAIFERTLELIGKPPRAGFLESVPLDDQAAFDVLNRGHFAGIFQFNGQALQSVTKQIIPINSIEDIISITAIARPGPAASGGTSTWTQRRSGKEAITTLHPMLTELTKDTYGVVIYQETVMKIVREMGGLSWEDTSAVRKAMSGRLGDEFFEQFWQKFRAGAMANGIPEDLALKIWRQINTMGSWAFNRSHAVAYGIVSYWCCWLKAYYPVEFAAATLDNEKEPGRQIAILRELSKEGIDYISFDLQLSTDRWTPAEKDGKRILIGPLTAVKGIGPAMMQEILDARARNEPLRQAITKLVENATTEIDSLFPVADAIRILHPDLRAIGIETEPTPCVEVKPGQSDVVIVGLADGIAPLDLNEPIRIARRGGRRIRGPTAALNIFMSDDSGKLLCRVDQFLYDTIGKEVVERGRPGKVLYALKGQILDNIPMMMVKRLKFLGYKDEGRRPATNISTPAAGVSLAVG